jgi:hypothetical protein
MVAAVSPVAAKVREAEISLNPSSYELKRKPRLVEQLRLPCCVSTALTAGMETLTENWPTLSPLFHYHVTRFDWGGANADGFLILSRALTVLDAKGICTEELHHSEYTEEAAARRPSSAAYRDGLTRLPLPLQSRYTHFSGASRVVWMREQLRRDRPVIIGFVLPMNYPGSLKAPNFEWLYANDPMPSASGHCVVALGYDDSRRTFRVQDSQGERLFRKGCWEMGYSIVDSPIVQEIYSLNS